ncbi:hypothetical protein [Pseudoroseomonas cervicalis]|uniref:hypothetical protein n=1 Tax=Teichococcus cervicalis TaxID=204525 RepID=UPI0022F1630B|nr:hypothetical protein [Pseudoroseomonas cervicalis]WBV42706.1 hypothetical protein PFY06_15900 [Pseudoroseomonas cervicalis]
MHIALTGGDDAPAEGHPMFTIYAIHAPTADRLEDVKAEMAQLGAPTIEVVDCGDHYRALEGSHRLAAAAALGLVPELVIHEQDDMLDISRFDWFDAGDWEGSSHPAGEVAGEIFSPTQAVAYSFDR